MTQAITTRRRGHQEEPISSDAPARQLALYLRQLRVAIGSPAYRCLALTSGYSQNYLSTTANGQWPKWCRVENYVDTIRKYAKDHQIDLDVHLCDYADRNGLEHGFDILERSRDIYAAQPVDVRKPKNKVTIPRQRTATVIDGSVTAAGAAQHVPIRSSTSIDVVASVPSPAPLPRRIRIDSGPAVPESLAAAATPLDLVASINDMIASEGWDISTRRWHEAIGPQTPLALLTKEVHDTLTGRTGLTWRTFVAILLACEAGCICDSEFHPFYRDWIVAWHRVGGIVASFPTTTTTDASLIEVTNPRKDRDGRIKRAVRAATRSVWSSFPGQ